MRNIVRDIFDGFASVPAHMKRTWLCHFKNEHVFRPWQGIQACQHCGAVKF